ncbi:MAG TPA: hypothetical protein VFG84_11375 [Gemmatimonadaceae bacterium]|nr:hypothetical protein [Gemmatimonadaceae bacterium]
MASLWRSRDRTAWRDALARYPEVVAAQGVARLADLDRWYRNELPASIGSRALPHVTHDELVRVTEWKMARGVWRARNLVLVRGNDDQQVVESSRSALAAVPHPTLPIATLSRLAGVGPATASAVAAAASPACYPFLDELVAAVMPDLGPVAWTLGYYARYAEGLRHRAKELGDDWTPVMVERSVWSDVGGKAGARQAS